MVYFIPFHDKLNENIKKQFKSDINYNLGRKWKFCNHYKTDIKHILIL